MAERMRAVVCSDFGEWSIEEVPRPSPGPDEVVLSVHQVQLSVTECQRFYGEQVSKREIIRRQMREGDGRVFGHELVGEVTDVGANVTSLSVGDRVYPPAKVTCKSCQYCTSGYPELCVESITIGNGMPGGLAEYVSLPAEILRPVPEGISDAEGAAMQPLNSAIVCTHDAHIQTGDVVAVIGTGVMGTHCGQLALLEGAGSVYGIDVVPEKLEFIEERGMIPIDARERDPVETILEVTNDVGADVVITAVGGDHGHMTEGDSPSAQALEMVRKAGKILQVGIILGETRIVPRKYRSKIVTWINPRRGVISTGPNSDTGDIAPRLVDDGRVVIDRYITHELDGLESFEEAVEITTNKPEYDALGPAQIKIN